MVMRANEITRERLRHLADLRPASGKVLSLYLNLDPSQFGTAQARRTEVNSVLNHAERLVRDDERLTHDERMALGADLERVREFLGNGFDVSGAESIAVFASSAADLFEVIKLPRPVDQDAVVDDVPHVEPLARIGVEDRWAVILASRRTGRILVGSRNALREVRRIESNQPEIDQSDTFVTRDDGLERHAIAQHLKEVSGAALQHLAADGFEWVLVGASQDLVHEVEARLHPDVARRVVGRVDVEIERSTPDTVLAAAVPQMDWHARRRQDAALRLLSERLAKGTAAVAGLEAVLEAANERRLEALTLDAGLRAAGARCPRCGWLGLPPAADACPADGATLEPVRDIVEAAVERAIAQSATVHVLEDRPELGPHGGIAALLRF